MSTLTITESQDLTESAKVRQGGNARASWRISADNLHKNLAHCDPAKKETVIFAFLWCIDRGIYLQDFASQISYDPKTIDQILSGSYRNPRTGDLYDIPDKLAESIRAWRKTQYAAAQLGDIDFVVTPAVKRIWQGCDLARESQTPVFIYGASHLGKTWALEHYAVENNHGATPLVRIPSASGLGGMVRAIAVKVGVSPNCATAELVERIKGAITKKQVLILDEVHQLIYTYRKESFFACLEVLRSIYDHCKCGMVICTTTVFQKRLEQEKKAALEQLFRRGVHRVQLGNIVLAKDAKVILAHHGLDWPDRNLKYEFPVGKKDPLVEKPLEILKQLAKEDGLKAITERIRYARKFSNKEGTPLNWQHFTKAHLTISASAQEPTNDWN
jgi:DNA transposition AAA+ family ATPase